MSADENNKKEEDPTFLRVHKYDPSTHATGQNRLIGIDNYDEFETKTLADLRKLLIDHGVFSSTDVKNFKVIAGESEKPPADGVGQLSVYYIQKKTRTNIDDETKAFLKNQLDLNLKGQKLSEADAKLLEASFNQAQWMASSGGKLSHAVDLNETQWDAITRTNCLLSGHRMVVYQKRKASDDHKAAKTEVPAKTTEMKVERSPYSAFQIKPRKFEKWEISEPSTSTDSELPELQFRIPRFRVDDDSYVTVYETQNALESSLATSSFSETSVEASIGASFWGVSAAAKGGFAAESKDDSVAATSAKQQTMHIAYKFPRVTLYLDPIGLEVTEECKQDILGVVDKQSLIDFSNKYGDIFPQRVQLGGVLNSSVASLAMSSQTKEAKARSLKISAAASFSSSFAQASVSASHGQGDSSNKDESEKDLTNSMAWEATGGDTTLCNNPSAWCATVGDYYNWRVIDQCDILPLYKVLGSIAGFGDVEDRFKRSANNAYQLSRVNFSFSFTDGVYKWPLSLLDETRPPIKFEEDFKTKQLQSKEWQQKRNDLISEVSQSGFVPCFVGEPRYRNVWTMEYAIPKGGEQKIPANTFAKIQNLSDQPARRSLAVSKELPGYPSRWVYQSSSENEDTFCLEPIDVSKPKSTIENGDRVFIKSSEGLYMFRDLSSGYIAMISKTEMENLGSEHSYATFVFGNIKVN
ncbi:uncharacterized protein PGRI_034360 [Penicillium griseofulvum]|uniref:MACPF-like domain-containing protein n=1 Tax=Penicillium patulum TaxID=5078 RepID=A0A135L9N7_PENPA|nr:uncharacterized protein PGRI_034360 [Penicillium griseofulvum]KXG45669.1 hypothetical protein PGRI_034360 [Penicillium griseofulvum]